MAEMLWTFLPVAALLTITPGAATMLVVHSAARGGRREALATTLGNAAGVMAWAVAAAVGLAAVVATSAVAFTVVKVAGAVALVYLGLRALLRGESAWLKRAQQACGAVLVGLGVRLAFERR